jgi:Zn-dependent oligopeptidase
MENKGALLVKHIDEMGARRLDYFTEWEKQGNAYANPEIRELSEQRRADLSAIFAEIPAASVGVKGALRTYLSDIREIQQYLSNDLTPKGFESITPTARKAVQDGAELKETVKPAVAAIERARAETVQGGAQ